MERLDKLIDSLLSPDPPSDEERMIAVSLLKWSKAKSGAAAWRPRVDTGQAPPLEGSPAYAV